MPVNPTARHTTSFFFVADPPDPGLHHTRRTGSHAATTAALSGGELQIGFECHVRSAWPSSLMGAIFCRPACLRRGVAGGVRGGQDHAEVAVPMAGYGSRDRPSEGVVSDLYAKVLRVDTPGRAGGLDHDRPDRPARRSRPSDVRRSSERTGLNRNQILDQLVTHTLGPGDRG